MFFKRASKNKTSDTADKIAANDTGPVVEVRSEPAPVLEAAAGSSAHSPLDVAADPPVDQVASVASEKPRGQSTADFEPEPGPIGQEHALARLAFGLDMPGSAYHIFVSGPPGLGKRVAVRTVLQNAAATRTPPSDWVVVRDFSHSVGSRVLELPRGRANPFTTAMESAIEALRSTLAMAFDDEETDFRRRAIDEEFRTARDGALEALNQKAAAQNIAVLRSSAGYVLAPMHEGKVVKAEVFGQLPEPMRDQIELRVHALQRELEKILDAAIKSDLVRRQRHVDLDHEIARRAVEAAFTDVKRAVADLPEVTRHLEAVAGDLVRKGAELTRQQHNNRRSRHWSAARVDARAMRPYLVAPLVAANEGAKGLPVVEEANPTLETLFGLCAAEPGDHEADRAHLSVRPGALHRAHCGALMLDANALAALPAVWQALKSVLLSESVPVGAALANAATAGSMPLNVKIVLVGTTAARDALRASDPDFDRLFQVHVPFAEEFPDTDQNRNLVARRLAEIVRQHALRTIDASGIAAILRECAGWAASPQHISLDIGRLTDLAREASLWASLDGHEMVSEVDVKRALAARLTRHGAAGDTSAVSAGST